LLGVLALVIAWPQPTQWLRTAPLHLPAEDAIDADRVEQLMRQMSAPRAAP
jgi:hypothetical protein